MQIADKNEKLRFGRKLIINPRERESDEREREICDNGEMVDGVPCVCLALRERMGPTLVETAGFVLTEEINGVRDSKEVFSPLLWEIMCVCLLTSKSIS